MQQKLYCIVQDCENLAVDDLGRHFHVVLSSV
jgi:hypothetical protein